MANVLDAEKQQQILALGKLGWTLRRIEQETGIRRETVRRYLKKAGIAVRHPGRWGHPAPKAAIEVITDSGVPPSSRCPPVSSFGREPIPALNRNAPWVQSVDMLRSRSVPLVVGFEKKPNSSPPPPA